MKKNKLKEILFGDKNPFINEQSKDITIKPDKGNKLKPIPDGPMGPGQTGPVGPGQTTDDDSGSVQEVITGCGPDYNNTLFGPEGGVFVGLVDANDPVALQQFGYTAGTFININAENSTAEGPNGLPCSVSSTPLTDAFICCASNNNSPSSYENNSAITLTPSTVLASWNFNNITEGQSCYCPDPQTEQDPNGNPGDMLLTGCFDESSLPSSAEELLSAFNAFLIENGDSTGLMGNPLPNPVSAFNSFDLYLSCAGEAEDIYGCMDGGGPTSPIPNNPACNYDINATIEDESCDYSCYGCADPDAVNYGDSVVTGENILNDDNFTACDGLFYASTDSCCEYGGCATQFATNSVLDGSITQVSCTVAQSMGNIECCDFTAHCGDPTFDSYVCNNDTYNTTLCVEDPIDELGPWIPNTDIGFFGTASDTNVCYNDDTDVFGCTIDIPQVINYNPEANVDDGSCIWVTCGLETAFMNGQSQSGGPYNVYTYYGGNDLAQFAGVCGFVGTEGSEFLGQEQCQYDNDTYCQFEGCRNLSGVPPQYQGEVGTPIPNLTNFQFDNTVTLYFANENNFGCETSTGAGDTYLDEDNFDCCARPGCGDPDAIGHTDEFYNNYGQPLYAIYSNGNGTMYPGGLPATYDPLGFDDDGTGNSCVYAQEGCLDDVFALNFDENATDSIPDNVDLTGNGGCLYAKDVYAYQCYPDISELEALVDMGMADASILNGDDGLGIGSSANYPRLFRAVTIGYNSNGQMQQPDLTANIHTFKAEGNNYVLAGCQDPTTFEPGYGDLESCNYNPYANFGGIPCETPLDIYGSAAYDCEGNCIDTDGDGVCDDDEIPGCTDNQYLEYNPNATDDDGSCATLIVAGCQDEVADNYNPEATVNAPDMCEYSCQYCPEYTISETIGGVGVTVPAKVGGLGYMGGMMNEQQIQEFCYGLGSGNTEGPDNSTALDAMNLWSNPSAHPNYIPTQAGISVCYQRPLSHELTAMGTGDPSTNVGISYCSGYANYDSQLNPEAHSQVISETNGAQLYHVKPYNWDAANGFLAQFGSNVNVCGAEPGTYAGDQWPFGLITY